MLQRRQILPELWPVFVLSQIFGVLPINFTSNVPQINRKLFIYCIIINIVYHIIGPFVLFNFAVTQLSKPNVGPYEILSILTTAIARVVLTLNTYHTIQNSRKVLFIFQEIISLNKILTIFHCRAIKIEIGIETFCLIFVSGVLHTYFSGLNLNDILSIINIKVVVFISICINLIQIQFYMICCILRYLFKSINQELCNYNNELRLENKPMITETRLNELRICYRSLCKIIDLVNETYGAHTMLNITGMNVFLQTSIDDLLICVYNIIFGIEHEDAGVGVFAVLWIFYEILEIMLYFIQGIILKYEVRA
jgi:hypothetical protein